VRANGAGVRTVTIERGGGAVACERCRVADTFWTRFRGLQLRPPLEEDEGLLIRPCGSVHTFFMRFPVDVVFLDAELTVLGVREAVRPWRAAAQRGAKAVLELPAGTAARAGIAAGERLREA
jgi:uncharacterized membrane protein (UPF0127 family)